ncbi:hypothetical protein E3N88_33851 [Mikania micrantha]|uniref:Cytochrome P450 n=1 Tax=Mikania micrantha TaxID=192012 RepID=A0A5N6MCQ2_9ASTR|nr:hypothetical protein E3N88_33851 [Mikania micrantha]
MAGSLGQRDPIADREEQAAPSQELVLDTASMMVSYHPYAMGRTEKLWGGDCMEFRPERWLKKEERTGIMRFVARDPYTYPVFQAGPRICLGKDMAFLQMKRVVAGVLRQFKVVPFKDDGGEPVFLVALTSKMKGGFPGDGGSGVKVAWCVVVGIGRVGGGELDK